MSNMIRTIFIITFAGAIVLLGARELQRSYVGRVDGSSVEQRKKEMLENLQGRDVRARMSPQLVKDEAERKKQLDEKELEEGPSAWGQFVEEITGDKE